MSWSFTPAYLIPERRPSGAAFLLTPLIVQSIKWVMVSLILRTGFLFLPAILVSGIYKYIYYFYFYFYFVDFFHLSGDIRVFSLFFSPKITFILHFRGENAGFRGFPGRISSEKHQKNCLFATSPASARPTNLGISEHSVPFRFNPGISGDFLPGNKLPSGTPHLVPLLFELFVLLV